MLSLPSAASSVLMRVSVAFTKPTFRRVLLLAVGALLPLRGRTVTGGLRTLRGVVPGHTRTYPRVFSRVPCLLGLFRVVCLIFAEHAQHHPIPLRPTPWYVKAEPTFSDVMATVRRLFRQETLFQQPS